ncbi:MAG: ferredoxin reductase family protein [Rhodopila sp.]|nr:ferredoxin reductase family protein [Rhodopila sp.]
MRDGQLRLPGFHPLLVIGPYVICVVAPLGAAVLGETRSRGFYQELSMDLAVAGLAMLFMQFALSGRFKFLSGNIGIDTLMRFHQLAARMVLGLLIAHPLLLVAPALWGHPAVAARMLSTMFTARVLRSGTTAWLLLVLLVPIAIYRDKLPISYEAWRSSHGLGGIAAAGFGLHHALSVGASRAYPPFVGSLLALSAFAIFSVLFVYGLKPLWQLRRHYRVVSNRKVAERMWEIVLEPRNGASIAFTSGQFAWLKFGRSPFHVSDHPFSICTTPNSRPRIAFLIKEAGDFTRRIGTIAVGTCAFVDGPFGTLTLKGRSPKGVVLIAGGVGFSPILGILRQLRAERFKGSVCLIYGNRVRTQVLFQDEIEAMKQELDLSVHLLLSEPPADWSGNVGELTAETLARCLDFSDLAERLYLVSGPPAMVKGVEKALRARGIPRRNIIAEHFKFA